MIMGKHKEWRKIAKRERRRKIRVMQAITRDKCNEMWFNEQTELESLEYKQIEENNALENDKWMKAEELAIAKWKALQEKIKKINEEKYIKEAKILQEWEDEQKRIKDEQEKLKKLEEERRRCQEIFIQRLEQYLSGDSDEPPAELLVSRETKPNTEKCPFFSKTACCRFGDQCSRNHQYPGISKVLLGVNFFTHFGLDNSNSNEYDTDVMLEYEDNETYKDFKEFFYDVLPEFEKFGKIVQFKVCNNFEKHLRGNLYVEYKDLRASVAAYRALHCRWYAGKQISLQFCEITSWKNAICGLQSGRRCPKGRACNFLHVFRNPDNLFNSRNLNQDDGERRSTRRWRWSESPEVELPKHRTDSERKKSHKSDYRKEDTKRRHHKSHRNKSDRRS